MSLFGKKHYIWLASVCRDMNNFNPEESNEYIEILAEALRNESSNFSISRFYHNIFCKQIKHTNTKCRFETHYFPKRLINN